MRAKHTILFAAILAAAALAGCTKTLKGQQLAEYCAVEKNADKDLCAVNTEIQKTRDALAVTDKTANEAKSLAVDAKATADAANAKTVNCATKTLRRVRAGSCDAGTTLVACTQTRYTTSAGGMAILRSIDDTSCRFNSRVLEVQVRCCSVGAPTMTAATTPAPAAPESKPAPTS
ncbi:MAG: hypothetical protein AB7M12_04935 [Hyphomonadaceae bacterium]